MEFDFYRNFLVLAESNTMSLAAETFLAYFRKEAQKEGAEL